MTARGFDVFDQLAAAAQPAPRVVTPTAPTPAAQATTARAATRTDTRLLRGFTYLLIFAGVAFLAALLVSVTPLGRIDADITVPFVAVCLAAVAAIAWGTWRA
jgi:hypothetical protein